MIRIPTHRTPTHPGEVLQEEFLKPLQISQRSLSEALQVSYNRINTIVNRRSSISPDIALRLARYFSTSPDFWMNLQLRWDLYHATRKHTVVLDAIKPRLR